MALSDKQEIFCREYLVDLNATQAALRAGYSEKTAKEQAARMLSKVNIQKRITEIKSNRNRNIGVDSSYVLRRLIDIDEMDVIDILNDDMSIKPITKWPKIWRQFISGFELAEMRAGSGDDKVVAGVLKKIKWPDKTKNLELLGRHICVQAFKDRQEISGAEGAPIQIISTEMTQEQAVEAYKKMIDE